MATIMRMPAVMAGATEAALQTWLVAVGDRVDVGQTIAEIETEKAVFDHEADAAGVVAGLLVEPGQSVAVGDPIAVLAGDGESAADALSSTGLAGPPPAVPENPAPEAPAPAPAPEAPAPETPAPAVPAPAAPAPVTGAATRSPESAASVTAPGPRRIFASPLVRRLAKERGLDLSAIQGTGPAGRIVRRDVERIPEPAAPAAASAAPQAPAHPPQSAGAAWTDVPHTPMRRAIARRLTESATSVPHFFLTAHCRVDDLLRLRREINTGRTEPVSVNDLVVKAVGAALAAVPEANAIWTPEATRRFSGADIGVAVSIEGGLVTPVVRGVDRMPLGELSATLKDLAARARAGRLRQQELEGGAFSVSNLGMLGIREFSAIINPPQAGILAVGAAAPQPVVAEDGPLAVATVMTVTLSADHRVLDGALAAQWLGAFQQLIENPLRMLV